MSKYSRTKNSILNILSGFAGQILVTVLKFVVRTIFISVLGKSYLGINGLFSDILTMLSLTELGFDTAINYRLYKPLATKDDKQVRMLMKFYKQAYRLIGSVILILGLLLIPALRFLIKDYDSLEAMGINAVLIFIMFLLQSVSSYLFFAYRSAVIKADQKTYIIDISGMAVNIVSSIVQILVLLFLKSFVLYTLTAVIFSIVTNIVNAIIAQKMYPDFLAKEKDSISKEEIKSMFKDCGALFVYKINGVVLKATDNLVLSTFIGLSMVGMYSNYLLFYSTIKTFLNKFYSACKASMGNLFATADTEKTYFFFEVMNFISILLYGTACVGIGVCANELIECWIGTNYIIDQPLSILIGIEIVFLGIQINLGQIRNISGAFRQMWFRPVLGIIVNLGVSIVLVQFIGIYGVIIGTITSSITTNFMVDPSVIHKYTFKNYKPVSYYYKKNITYFAILALLEIVDFIICKSFFTDHGWASVILHIAICGISVPAVYIGIYWKTDICRYLRKKMISLFSKKLKAKKCS